MHYRKTQIAMNNYILNYILSEKEKGNKLIALLLDPDKVEISNIETISKKIKNTKINLIFVGGSTVDDFVTEIFIKELKNKCPIPILIFPGDCNQITQHADALLFLSLLSGNNPEYLIHQQVKAVPILKNLNLEVIPTGYILIDGGNKSAIERVSNTFPIPQNEISKVSDTALAGQFMGKQLIYLEAGSGAINPVSTNIISEVKKATTVPIIVGGGLRSKETIDLAFDSGADIVVIGTIFEQDENFLKSL
jgi:putative glycerol-1-phosphate prenyltransferase